LVISPDNKSRRELNSLIHREMQNRGDVRQVRNVEKWDGHRRNRIPDSGKPRADRVFDRFLMLAIVIESVGQKDRPL
jgi:hypothetical protein